MQQAVGRHNDGAEWQAALALFEGRDVASGNVGLSDGARCEVQQLIAYTERRRDEYKEEDEDTEQQDKVYEEDKRE